MFAYFLADAQSDDRAEVQNRFRDVAAVSASVTDGIFQSALQSTQLQAASTFGGPVDRAALDAFGRRGRLAYAAVLDDDGRRLAATSGTPRGGAAVSEAIETGKARLSDVMGSGDGARVEWAIPFAGAAGQRVFVQGIPLSAFADFLETSLGRLPNVADAETVMVDGRGVVLGGPRLSTPVGERLEDAELLEALPERDYGTYGGDRYFASGAIGGSPFRIVLDTSESDLYDSLSGQTISWVIFGALALMALLGLYLLRRAALATSELERRALSERHAVDINDNIIQGLALAKYQLQAGQGEASAAQVAETLREAQRLVSSLLGEAEVQAGQLRREVPAETTRPEPPESGRSE